MDGESQRRPRRGVLRRLLVPGRYLWLHKLEVSRFGLARRCRSLGRRTCFALASPRNGQVLERMLASRSRKPSLPELGPYRRPGTWRSCIYFGISNARSNIPGIESTEEACPPRISPLRKCNLIIASSIRVSYVRANSFRKKGCDRRDTEDVRSDTCPPIKVTNTRAAAPRH